MTSELPTLPFKSLREMVADALRRAILDGTIKPGQKILEGEVATHMGISRSPVREALRQLEREGIVHNVPNKGTIVRELSEGDVAHLYGIRAVLEGLAAAWSCKHITPAEIASLRVLCREMWAVLPITSDESRLKFLHKDVQFHEVVVSAARSRSLTEALVNIQMQIRMAMAVSTVLIHPVQGTAAEHDNLVDILERRDPLEAERAFRVHIETSGERLLKAGLTVSTN